jgi:hypothetical protein
LFEFSVIFDASNVSRSTYLSRVNKCKVLVNIKDATMQPIERRETNRRVGIGSLIMVSDLVSINFTIESINLKYWIRIG